MVVMMMMVCGQTLKVCSAEAAAFCGLVLVFGSKLVSCDAAGLPFGMVSEPRRRLEPTLAGGLVEYLADSLARGKSVCPKPKQFVLGGRGALGLIPDVSWGGGKATAQRKM